jgi:CheY-like chemotaxis protein
LVWLTASPGDGVHEAVRLTVKDRGPVIAPDASERLFRPFSRLDRPEGEDPAGTGLGLSICLQLVTLMGGKIGCATWTSDDGRDGNAFWVTLPAAALALRAAPWPSDAAAGPAVAGAGETETPSPGSPAGIARLRRRPPPRTRILLTEDIVANQVVTATLLRREGHHVDIATNGPAAIRAVQATPYDLVFMDIFMPGMSGQEATQIIRGLPEPARSTPIIALTANIGPEDEAIFRAAGMGGILGKPVSLAALLGVLDRYVWSVHTAAAVPPPAAAVPPPADSGAPVPSEPGDSTTVPVLAAERIDELRTNLPPETFARLVEECLVDMAHRLPALRRALAAGAPGTVATQAHALVGMAAGYGMAAMEVRLRAIMAAARAADLTPLGSAVVAGLEADFAEAARTLREILRQAAA